jgi:hypothetical protein
MLQTAKNLAKFISAVKPNADAFISAGIRNDGEAEAFIYLHKGNGREIFAKLITCPTLELSQMESTSDKYIDLKGMYDGYKLRVTFLNERDTDDLVTLERHDPKAGYPELAKCSAHWNYMTPEEWENFIENAGGHDAAKRKMEFNENGNRAFGSLISGGFAWDESKEGSRYWLDIYYRTEPIV